MTHGPASSLTFSIPQVGALYSIENGDGVFSIVKLLAVDGDGVHVRLYKNKFPLRPLPVDPATLSLGSIYDADGFGMGHMPLSYSEFDAWLPLHMSDGSVTEEELEGYREWQSAGGGYFGAKSH
jgi:hypothetical protein